MLKGKAVPGVGFLYKFVEEASIEVSFFAYNKVVVVIAQGNFVKFLDCPGGPREVVERALLVILEYFFAYIIFELLDLREKLQKVYILVNRYIAGKLDEVRIRFGRDFYVFCDPYEISVEFGLGNLAHFERE